MSWAYPCDICAAKVCKKCLRKVASPVDEVQEAAAYMLYPLDTPENQVVKITIFWKANAVNLQGQLGRRWEEIVSL